MFEKLLPFARQAPSRANVCMSARDARGPQAWMSVSTEARPQIRMKAEEDTVKQRNTGSGEAMKKIVVLGSLNYDVFLQMKRMPEVGETLEASDDIFKAFGGKGSNQAIAAARLNPRFGLTDEEAKDAPAGFQVQMRGQIGDDAEGKAFIEYLEENGIDHSGIITQNDSCTGQAYILSLKETADNSIVIVGGSNQKYEQKAELNQVWKEAIAGADILML